MDPSDLQRRYSGRDQKKAEKQRLSLGSSTGAREAQSFNLVVCGTHKYKDGWMFSDFMGICMALREHGVGGDFLSCFPLERHFIWLRNEHSPPIDVIKFGKYGRNGEKALYTYSRHTFLNREYWWTQVGVHELLERVERWIYDKQQVAQPGDVINIILEGHGTENGEYIIGDRWVHPYVFRDLLSGFKDVQVNAISGMCHSGALIDAIKTTQQKSRYLAMACIKGEVAYSTTRSISNRFRNGRFSYAFVQSLARINLPGAARRKVAWNVNNHEAFMRDQITRNLTPGAIITEPQFFATEPIDGMVLVEELIFRDKIDILYDPRVAARRRRIEWPTADRSVWDQIASGTPYSPVLSEHAKAVLEAEVAMCDTRRGLVSDMGVYDELYTRDPNWKHILQNLYWRARRQSTVWDVFELLVNRGFINPACLTIPVALLGSSEDVWYVSVVLGCFALPYSDSRAAFRDKIPEQRCEWNTDIHWLATMIVRSGADLPHLLSTIRACGFLGEFLEEEFSQFRSMYPDYTISQNPRENEGQLLPDGSVAPRDNVFGFWLPHGLRDTSAEDFADQIRQCKVRFNEIERAFRESEGIPKEKLWLEEEQVALFDAHPELLPGAMNDLPASCVVSESPPST